MTCFSLAFSRRLLGFIAAVTLMSAPAYAQGSAPSAAGWGELLSTYVVSGDDSVDHVRYGELKANQTDRAKLDAYIDSFAAADLSDQTPENFAALSNLYNAVTVRYVVEKYPVDSIKDGYLFGGPWKKIKVTVGGEALSLDTIEHKILRKYGEPRVHYALNCASIGCPNLRTVPWRAETLDVDLDMAASDYINHPRGVTVTEKGLRVSSIYDWFEDDFGGNKDAVVAHLLEYASPELAEQIKASPKITSYDYDWPLNDAP